MSMIGNLLPITSLDLLRLKEAPESLPGISVTLGRRRR